MDYCKVILVGRVTADPELRSTPGGQPVTTIRVATNRTWTDKDNGKQESVQFHNVVIWGKQAEVAATWLQKGSECLIEGRLETREWTDKQNVKRWMTEIICENLQLGQRPQGEKKAEPKTEKAAPAAQEAKPEARTVGGDEEDTGRGMTDLFGGEPKGEINPAEIPF
jgi:single-strand DNA-binding protein